MYECIVNKVPVPIFEASLAACKFSLFAFAFLSAFALRSLILSALGVCAGLPKIAYINLHGTEKVIYNQILLAVLCVGSRRVVMKWLVQECYLPLLPHRPCPSFDVFRGEKRYKKNEKKPK